MKKLKLNLDEIKVESFETATKKENPIGTVIGQLKELLPSVACGTGGPTCNTCSPMECDWTGPDVCPW